MNPDENVPTSAGLSSFNLLEEHRFFSSLALVPGMTLLDYGCGVGNYTVAVSPYLGENGFIYAVDPWEEGIETLEVRTSIGRIDNVAAAVCAAGEKLPVGDRTVDIALMATVVHILVLENQIRDTLAEIQRVLRAGGTVAVVEFYKKEGPPGPPLSWRLSPDELIQIFESAGFQHAETLEVGLHNYLTLFSWKGCR